jgi:hypothetical protein
MAMYAVAIIPLIHRLSEERIKQVWFADDASAAGKLSGVKDWWNNISKIGPEYGYFPNADKTWLVKERHFEEAIKAAFSRHRSEDFSGGKEAFGFSNWNMFFCRKLR